MDAIRDNLITILEQTHQDVAFKYDSLKQSYHINNSELDGEMEHILLRMSILASKLKGSAITANINYRHQQDDEVKFQSRLLKRE